MWCAGPAARATGAGRSEASPASRAWTHEDRVFLRREGGSYGTLSETAGLGLVGPTARLAVTGSRDDVWDDISQADVRNGNPERDAFRSTQRGLHALPSSPPPGSASKARPSKHSHADIDIAGLLSTGEVGLADDLGAFGREETWVA